MKRRILKKVLSVIIGLSLVTQSFSLDTFASETAITVEDGESEIEEEPTEEESTEDASLDEAEAETETETEAVISSETEIETDIEAVSEIETKTETEIEAETETEDATEEIELYEDTQNAVEVSFDTDVSFYGFEAQINKGTTITIANLDDCEEIDIYFIQYAGDDLAASDRIEHCFDVKDGVYTLEDNISIELCEATTYIAFRVVADDEKFESDKKERSNKPDNVKFSVDEISTGISELYVTLNYTGDMRFGGDITDTDFNVKLYYGTDKDETAWTTTWAQGMSFNVNKDELDGNYTVNFTSLNPDTTYYGKIVVYKYSDGYQYSKYMYGYYQEIDLPEFTTKSDEIINFKEAFPDVEFRKIIAAACSYDEAVSYKDDTIDISKLEMVTYIGGDKSNIEDITGIDLLTNLKIVSLVNNNISDISGIDWGAITNLQYLYLTSNYLTSVPDFSANTNLRYLYLNRNLLSDDAIASIKAPTGCNVNIDNQLEQNIYASLNIYSILSDISLPDGWEWVNPDTKLEIDKDNPTNPQSIDVKYTENSEDYYTKTVNVYLYKLNGITLEGLDALDKGDEETYEIKYDFSGMEYYDDLTTLWEVSSDDGSVLALESEASNINKALISAQSAGSGKLKVTVAIATAIGENELYSSSLSITVLDEESIARIGTAELSPKLDTTKIVAYTYDRVQLPIYANTLNPIKAISLESGGPLSDYLEVSMDDEGKMYIIASNISRNKSGKATFIIETKYAEYRLTSNVTINTSKPSVKFKQGSKLNLFYKSSEVTFTVTSSDQIENIELANPDTKFNECTYDGSTLTIKTNIEGNDYKSIDVKKGITVNLNVKFKSLGTLPVELKIATEKKQPSLSINSANVVAGQTNLTTNIINTKTKEVVSEIDWVSLKSLVVNKKNEILLSNVDVNEGKLYIDSSNVTSSLNYTIIAGSENWNEKVSLNGKLTYVKTPTVVLESRTAIITSLSNTSKIQVSIKNSSFRISARVEAAKNSKGDEYVNVRFDDASQCIVAKLNENVAIPNKKTTFAYVLKSNDNIFKDVKFNVELSPQSPTVTFKTKGSINLVNKNEYITLTPVIKNTTAKVESIDIKDSSMFNIKPLGNGTYKLSYNENTASLDTKTKYTLILGIQLDDGTNIEATVKNIKPTTKLPSVKVDTTNTTLYKSNKKKLTAKLTTTSKTGANPIEKIEIADTTIKDLFNISYSPNTKNQSNATITLSLSDEGKTLLKSGKKYKVTCYVYFESVAANNIPAKVNFNITVK